MESVQRRVDCKNIISTGIGLRVVMYSMIGLRYSLLLLRKYKVYGFMRVHYSSSSIIKNNTSPYNYKGNIFKLREYLDNIFDTKLIKKFIRNI